MAEVLTLWESAGIPEIDSGFTEDNLLPISILQALVGITRDTSGGFISQCITADLAGSFSPRKWVARLHIETDVSGFAESMGMVAFDHEASPLIGSCLVRDITFEAPVTFSGVLRDRDGTVVPNQLIGLFNPTSESTTTAADGSFSLTVAPDATYGLSVTRGGVSGDANIPEEFRVALQEFPLTSNRVQDLTLHNVFLDVTVRDPTGELVPNSVIDVMCYKVEWNSEISLAGYSSLFP